MTDVRLTYAMSEDERRTIVTALHAYGVETDTYLRSFGPLRGHDDCCPTARARNRELERQRDGLKTRRAWIDSALATLGGADA
jgi:hypothetical protein